MNRPTSDHARLDERSLALHRRVAKKILADPALLSRARMNVRRWQAANATPSLALAEWEGILDMPVEEIAALLTERSERADRLRQSTPLPASSPKPSAERSMNRTQLEHVIRAASEISEKDLAFNQALLRHGCVTKRKLLRLAQSMPLDGEAKERIVRRIKADFVAANPRRAPKTPRP
jgi:hypothetical protein